MAYITKKQTRDGVKPIGSNLYGTCNTASGTATKVVSMPDFNVLVEGVTIHVYFANANTASSPTLQVGSAEAKPIRHNGTTGGSWENGGFISFTYYNGAWHQNDITIGGVTYTFTISGHTMTINGSDGSVQTVTLPDNNTTYTLTKSGSTITLTGSDGSTTTVSDADTKYGLQLQNGKLKLVEGGSSSEITLPDDDTTYSISISGHTVTLTGSDGSTSTVTVPDDDTTYTISKSGSTITLTGSDGSTTTVTDADTTYGIAIDGHTVKLVAGGSGTQVTVPDNDTTYTLGINGRKITLTPSSGSAQEITLPTDSDTTYTLSISGNKLTLTPSSGSAQEVTLPDNDTTYTLSINDHTLTLTPSSGTAQTVTLPNDNTDTKVTETNTTGDADYRVLFSATADDTTRTEGARKNTNIRYNPSVGELKVQGMDSVNATYKSINSDVTKAEIQAQDSSLTTSSTDSDWMKALVKAICVKYPNKTNYVFRGYISPNSSGYYEVLIYNTSTVDSTTKLPQYCYGTLRKYYNVFSKFWTSEYAWGFANVDTNTDVRKSFYGTCDTAAATAAKVVTLGNTAGWSLLPGTVVCVKFTNTNTANNPTLNVNSSGAKSVWYNTAAVTTGSLNRAGYANRPQLYMYDGTYWVWVGHAVDENSNNRKSFYGTCSSGAAETTKVVTLANTTGWELVAGTIIGVRFTTSSTASNVKLNVNGTGAKSIYYNNAVYTGSTDWVTGRANTTIFYMYDGTNWVWLSHSADNNTTYSDATTSAHGLCPILYSRTQTGGLDWGEGETAGRVMTKGAIAFWNGSYDGTNSNLSRCKDGYIIGSNGFSRIGTTFACTAKSVGANGGEIEVTATMTKSGYYPIALCGVDTNMPQGMGLRSFIMTNSASGTCTCKATYTNTTASAISVTTSHKVAFYIMWAKIA